jgi:hypothetical protein
MSDFIKSNPKLDEAVNNATNFEALREAMLQTLESQGRIVRGQTAYERRVVPQAPEPEPNVPLSASGYRYEREVRFAESTGKRTLIIRANSIEDLNRLEKQVTGEI